MAVEDAGSCSGLRMDPRHCQCCCWVLLSALSSPVATPGALGTRELGGMHDSPPLMVGGEAWQAWWLEWGVGGEGLGTGSCAGLAATAVITAGRGSEALTGLAVMGGKMVMQRVPKPLLMGARAPSIAAAKGGN